MSMLFTGLKLGRTLADRYRQFFVSSSRRIIFHDEAKKCFLFNLEYGKTAQINYKFREDVMNVIDLYHTYVPHEYRGKGIAYLMAEEVFQYLAENGIKATISCPFLIGFVNDHPQFKDVVVKIREPEKHDP